MQLVSVGTSTVATYLSYFVYIMMCVSRSILAPSVCLSVILADGLALGAAAGLSKADVELIIFLAIMLHKAPAAFGFTSFLIHEVRDVDLYSTILVQYIATFFYSFFHPFPPPPPSPNNNNATIVPQFFLWARG